MTSQSKVKLKVLGLSYSQTQSGAYALVLAEERGTRRIPIIVGGFEAQAIAIELEKLTPPRPLTHDLFVNFAKSFNINLVEVDIYRLDEGVFYSKLICEREGEYVEIDARTSDAVALAIRCDSPIYTTKQIIEKTGIVFNTEGDAVQEESHEQEEPQPSEGGKYDRYNLKELQDLLHKSISNEDYEEASHIRDEIQRRESEK